MLNAVKHLYRTSNQFRLRAVEMLQLCRMCPLTPEEAMMCRKNIFLPLLFTLSFYLVGFEQKVANAQSTSVTTATLKSQRAEAQILKLGIARRRVGEPDTSFLRRVFPVAYPCTYINPCAYDSHILSYAWRPSPFGKQLFFSNPNGGDEGIDLILFILDPFRTNAYAVQAFNMGNMGDLTVVRAIFFADVEQDGRKEVLVLNECNLREGSKDDNGAIVYGRAAHYEIFVLKYIGLDASGRPRYREDKTPRSYLNELPNAAAVRQAITRHQRKTAKPR